MQDFDRALALRGFGKPGDPLTFAEITHGFAPPDGFTGRLEELSVDPLGVRISYIAADGTRAATLVRHFEHHGVLRLSVLDVAKPWRGQDLFSATINGQTLLRVRKWGLRRIVVRAQDAGRYAWALAGFSFDDPRKLVAAGDAFIAEHVPDGGDAHRQILRALVATPWMLARWDDRRTYDWSFTDAAGTQHAGRSHLGKALLLGAHVGPWGGHLDVEEFAGGFLVALTAFKVGART